MRLTTPEQVKRYIAHPEIFEAISEDGMSFEEFEPVAGEEDHFIVTAPESMFYLHPFCANVLQIHAHVHPDYRQHAFEGGIRALQYGFNELSALKIVALIPEIFPRVRGFAHKCGFVDECFIDESYIKNGEIYGQYLLGIGRRKFESTLWDSPEKLPAK